MIDLTRSQIQAFRLSRQQLAEEAKSADVLRIMGACGIQESPHGSGLLALSARVSGFSADQFSEILARDKTAVQLWAMRGTPYLIPANEASVYTAGLYPENENDCLAFIQGAKKHLERFKLSAQTAVSYTNEAVQDVLKDRQLTKDDLGRELAQALAKRVPAAKSNGWEQPDGIGQNTFGQSLVRYALYVVSLKGLLCFIPKDGRKAAKFALTRDWLGRELPAQPVTSARAELVRRYLHCYGPATLQSFTRWAGVSEAFAQTSFDLVQNEMTKVRHEGQLYFAHKDDIATMQASPMPRGIKLLAPGDPLLALQQKEFLVPNTHHRQQLWRPTGSPGAVLVDGEVAGLWRQHKDGHKLTIQIEPFRRRAVNLSECQVEAERIARMRMATIVKVVL